MDMDMESEFVVEKDGVVLVRDEYHVVHGAGPLPNEVQHLLREGGEFAGVLVDAFAANATP